MCSMRFPSVVAPLATCIHKRRKVNQNAQVTANQMLAHVRDDG
jgi:hypothetical protein